MKFINPSTISAPLLTIIGFLSLPVPAGAQVGGQGPAYTERDIVERFAPASLGASRGVELGATRGICIGTEADCPSTAASTPSHEPRMDLVVTFDHNSDELTGAAKQNLREFAKALKNERLNRVSFLVEGHTDAKGGDGYNLNLSERRAQAVVLYLVSQDVDGSRVVAKGYGETKPRSSDPLDPANRRVETRVNTASTAQAAR